MPYFPKSKKKTVIRKFKKRDCRVDDALLLRCVCYDIESVIVTVINFKLGAGNASIIFLCKIENRQNCSKIDESLLYLTNDIVRVKT